MKYNNHQFKKFYKSSQPIVDYLRAFYVCFGVTVSAVLVEAINARFDVLLTTQWVTVILKSANIPRASRRHRRHHNTQGIAAKADLAKVYKNIQPGLCLFEALFMQGAGRIIAETLYRRNSEKLVHDLGMVIMSGMFKRLSNYESGDIPGIEITGQSLVNAITKLTTQEGLSDILNANLLRFWIDQEIKIERIYADGHTKIFYTSYKSLSGKMSASERIGAGTRMVMIHQQNGMLLWLQMHRIDEHLGRPFIFDTAKVLEHLPVVEQTIPLITDREGSAQIFSEEASEAGIALLTLLKPSCYHGMIDFVEDPQQPDVWKWASESKVTDGRRFYIIQKENTKPLVFSLNFDEPSALSQLPEWYKGRWNGNENPLRSLSQSFAFNVNTGQRVEWIDNPKQIKAQKLASEQKPKLESQYQTETKKQPHKPHRIVEKQQKLEKIQKKINRLQPILDKPIEKVAVKLSQADHIVSLFKATLLNLVLFLLITIQWKTCNAQEADFVIKAIIRRKGDVKIYNDRMELRLKPMSIKKQRLKQAELIRQINMQNFKANDGKQIIFKLLAQREKIPKNSSFG